MIEFKNKKFEYSNELYFDLMHFRNDYKGELIDIISVYHNAGIVNTETIKSIEKTAIVCYDTCNRIIDEIVYNVFSIVITKDDLLLNVMVINNEIQITEITHDILE